MEIKLEDLIAYRILFEKHSPFSYQIEKIYYAVKDLINAIPACYKNYTMHNMDHGLRVVSHMENIIGGVKNCKKKLKKFSDLELALIILSGMLHDIGMFYSKEELDKKISNNNSISDDDINTIMQEENIIESFRANHHERIKKFLNNDIIKPFLIFENCNFADDLMEICIAHGDEHNYLKSLNCNRTIGNYNFNLQYIAAMLRISDYLDYDAQRTPLLWYKYNKPIGYSDEEWKKHFIIDNYCKIEEIDGNYKIFFEGKCEDAVIYRKYLEYIDKIKNEIDATQELLDLSKLDEKYKFRIITKVDNRVKTIGFTYADLKLSLNYQSITTLLMGHNIYGNKKLGLRELMQNSIDSCNLMKEIYISNGIIDTYYPTIIIEFSKTKDYVTIKDNGTGMSLDIIKKYFLNIGLSYYNSCDFKSLKIKYKPIGKFGIGFLACYLLSDKITVKTKNYLDNNENLLELEKGCEYVVIKIQDDPLFKGTEIKLQYTSFFEVFNDINTLKKFIEEVFFTDIKIKLVDKDLSIDVPIKQIEYDKMLDLYNKSKFNYTKSIFINCKSYSKLLEGYIILDHMKYYKITSIDPNSYLFNVKEDEFLKIDNATNIEDGIYYIVKYPYISDDEYKCLKKNSLYNKLAIMDIHSRTNEYICFYINEALLTENRIANIESIMINGKSIMDNIIESNINNSIIDAFDEYDFFSFSEKYYISSNKKLLLTSYDFSNFENNELSEDYTFLFNSLFNSENFENDILEEFTNIFKFYNSGILIDNKNLCQILAPFKFDSLLFIINNINIDISLDVSRRNVLSNFDYVEKEITNIILKYHIQKFQRANKKEHNEKIDIFYYFYNNLLKFINK